MTKEFNPHTISLIAGLGNPGDEYHDTLHNAGRLIVESILKTHPRSAPKKSFECTKIGQYTFVLPSTFMNDSGKAIHDALTYFKLPYDSLLVIHDDTDLPIGATKLQFGRGDAGHNGIKSIVNTLGTKEFWRFRVGIRKAEHEGKKREKAASFVLSSIKKKEKNIIESEAEIVKKILFF